MPTSLHSHIAPLNRLSEQEEEEDDGDDDDDDVEDGCENDVMDNVSKNSTSSNIPCYSGLGDSKLNAYSCAADVKTTHSHSLRKRNNTASASTKSARSKCVQFVPSTKSSDQSSHSTMHSPAELNVHSKPLKKIIFNGTFPIDDPYSSRF